MLRRNFKMPGNMVVTDRLQVPGIIGKGQVVPDAGTDENVFDAGDPANPGEQPALFLMTGMEIFAGRAAPLIRTGTAGFPLVAGEMVHIRRWASNILDNTSEGRHLRHAGYFTDD